MTFASGGNHGIFIFARFFVRCRNWRRKDHHIRRKTCRPTTNSPGFLSPLLFGLSLIFWNIFGVCASTGITTMSNSNNSTHSTSKLNNNNTQELITTEPEESGIFNQTCDDNKTKTCTNTTRKPCDLDFTVCNNSTNNTEVVKTVCENYTCTYNKVGEDEMEDSEVCVAHKCLQLEYTECADCLCDSKEADIKAQKHLTEFNDILKRVDCKRPYSLWNCTHCLAVYKHWICATQGLYKEDESKPCLAMCTSVMSNCPYLVPHKLYGGSPSFQCPKFSDLTHNHTYASQKGKCFTCNNTQANISTPCLLSTQATNHSHRFTSKFGLLVWLVFLMRISVYFNTESYL